MNLRLLTIGLMISCLPVTGQADSERPASPSRTTRSFKASEVFDSSQRILFQTDFQSGAFDKLKISEDDRYGLPAPSPDRLAIVPAPDSRAEARAVRFLVPHTEGAFRSEIAFPHETGYQERWYSTRIYVPADWEIDPDSRSDIVMQWHAIPGNWRATFPNAAIAVGGSHWELRRSFGAAQTGPERRSLTLAPLMTGRWVKWTVHVRWSPAGDGLFRVWMDDRLVAEETGPNVYTTIGVAYTPYFKTGIYRPAWKPNPNADDNTPPTASPLHRRLIYVTDICIGQGAPDELPATSPPLDR